MIKMREELEQQKKDTLGEYSLYTHKNPDTIKLRNKKVELEGKLD